MAALSSEEKERILKAVEEDREFRYALMGLLGYKEILDRITKLEEHFAELEKRQQKLEERFAELEKRFAELEERFAKLEERFARIEERQLRLEERQQRLEERQQRLEERFARIEKEMLLLRRTVTVIAHRFGVISEESFREGMKYVVGEVLGVARVERWVHRDDEGFVYGYPSIVEVDVVVRDGEHVIVEVKSRVSRADVSELHRIGALYERVVKVKPRLLIIGGFIDKDAWDLARRLGVELRPVIED